MCVMLGEFPLREEDLLAFLSLARYVNEAVSPHKNSQRHAIVHSGVRSWLEGPVQRQKLRGPRSHLLAHQKRARNLADPLT